MGEMEMRRICFTYDNFEIKAFASKDISNYFSLSIDFIIRMV